MWTDVSEVDVSEVVHLLQPRAEVIGHDRLEGWIADIVLGQAGSKRCVRQGEKRVLLGGRDVGVRGRSCGESAERPRDG